MRTQGSYEVWKAHGADADGLHGFVELSLRSRGPLIITPHSAEAAVLLECDVAAVQSDRISTVHALAARVGGTAVLKGVGTLNRC